MLSELQGKQWLCRGQPERHKGLIPSIDRDPLRGLTRPEKLDLECRSIRLFQSTARFFSHPGEQLALSDRFIALMVLRHYGVPTRLLDWTGSPFVAAYFAASGDDGEDGALWAFDRPFYQIKGQEQWKRWPETTSDGSGDASKFDGNLTAFRVDEPPDWFIAVFYPVGFPRQNAQSGAYTCTARFGRDHSIAIAELLEDRSRHTRYILKAAIKPALRNILRERYGIWCGSLFPDTAGAAALARTAFPIGSGEEWQQYVEPRSAPT